MSDPIKLGKLELLIYNYSEDNKEIEIRLPYNSIRGNTLYIKVYVTELGIKINIPATGTLNSNGEEVLADALTLARLIKKYNQNDEE